MRIGDVNPGDILKRNLAPPGMPDWGVLLVQCPHPIYDGLSMFIWRLSNDEYSFDALNPDMQIEPSEIRKPMNQDIRVRNLRWAVGQHGANKPNVQ